jgi:hypothetical protein
MLNPTLPGALCALLLAGTCSAQMSGAYTINSAGAGARNYKSFTAAANALAAAGIKASVVFHVQPGTITESWTMPAVRGSSATKTVGFQGVASPPAVYLNRLIGRSATIITLAPGASNVIFDGFDFVSTTAGHAIAGDANNGGGAVRPISNIEIRNCRFGTGIAGNRGNGHIQVLGGGQSRDWSIHDCVFNMGKYANGIYMHHMAACKLFRNWFHVSDTRRALFWENMKSPDSLICNNLFTGSVRSPESACILHVWAGLGATDICFNTFRVTMSGAAICTEGSPLAYNRIYANVISVRGFGRGIDARTRPHWQSDGNLFDIQSGIIGQILRTRYRGLSAWRMGTRKGGAKDSNSLSGNPFFKSATDHHLTSRSPGIGKAVVPSRRFNPGVDFDGWFRGDGQDIGAYELTGYRLYGKGCPGTGGVIPMIALSGNVAPLESGSIDLAGGRANSPVVLSIGGLKATIPTGPGCNLLHTPSTLFFLRSNAVGSASLPVRIPALAVSGISVFLQFAVHDPAAPRRLALTPGAEVRL